MKLFSLFEGVTFYGKWRRKQSIDEEKFSGQGRVGTLNRLFCVRLRGKVILKNILKQ